MSVPGGMVRRCSSSPLDSDAPWSGRWSGSGVSIRLTSEMASWAAAEETQNHLAGMDCAAAA